MGLRPQMMPVTQGDHGDQAHARLGLLRAIGEVRRAGFILDVECRRGDFVHACAQEGYRAAGCTADAEEARAARARYGVRVLPHEFIRARGRFDMITAWDVLGYLCTPEPFLQWAQSALAPAGARLVVEMPEWQSPYHARMGATWPVIRPPRRRAIYSRAGAESLFLQHGFHVQHFVRPAGGEHGTAVWVLRREGDRG